MEESPSNEELKQYTTLTPTVLATGARVSLGGNEKSISSREMELTGGNAKLSISLGILQNLPAGKFPRTAL